MDPEHKAFQRLRTRRIDNLDLDIHHYTHVASRAVHYHFETGSRENVFMVAFRTLPDNSTGVAHVLEHTVLCGSERYPVRDPFFLMIRRSLNTFMNAFTTSDYTAYPFASQNRTDYFNLIDVYLDAAFFCRLEELDFAQEGHRLEFQEPLDATTPLVRRGVVYNEMKGDSASPVSCLYREVQKILFPATTYHYSSGGDPEHIPELRYEDLLSFHRTHYCPSNALFMTFGDADVFDIQERIDDVLVRALAGGRYDNRCGPVMVPPEKRFRETKRVETRYATDPGQSEHRTHIVLAWLLGKNTDLEMLLKCRILSDVLLDTSASPLKRALEEFEHAAGLSPLCGLEAGNHEMSFMCGVEGSDPEFADDLEKRVLDVLETLAEEGIATDRLEAVLHQLELSHREIGGDGMPWGLQLIFSCIPAAVHQGDPIRLLDIDPVIEDLREQIRDPGFIRQLVSELLLENRHRVRVVMKPDPELAAMREEAERAELQKIRDGLTRQQTERLIARAAALMERQKREEDVDVLPKVGLDDVPGTLPIPEPVVDGKDGITGFVAGTNGIVYHQVVCEIPELRAEQIRHLPLYAQLLSEVGSGNRDYLETQMLQHAVTGGVSAWSTIRAEHVDPFTFRSFFTVSSRTLVRQADPMIDLVIDTLMNPRFDETARIRDLVRQLRARQEANIAGNGHTLALAAAGGCLRPVPRLYHEMSGIEGIRRLCRLDDSLDDPELLQEFCAGLGELRDRLAATERHLLVVTDERDIDDLIVLVRSGWKDREASAGSPFRSADISRVSENQAFVTNTPVNYCASVLPVAAEDHPDSAALTVLAAVLRNGYLHHAIREEGGAYGAGASHDAANGLFRFYSYRDPNLTRTFDAFLDSIDWVLKAGIDFPMVEEAILGIVSSIDAPASPAGEARQAFHSHLHGRSPEHRRRIRSRILEVTGEDIKRVAAHYLTGEGCLAVVTSESGARMLDSGFHVQHIRGEP